MTTAALRESALLDVMLTPDAVFSAEDLVAMLGMYALAAAVTPINAVLQIGTEGGSAPVLEAGSFHFIERGSFTSDETGGGVG